MGWNLWANNTLNMFVRHRAAFIKNLYYVYAVQLDGHIHSSKCKYYGCTQYFKKFREIPKMYKSLFSTHLIDGRIQE